MDDAKQVAVNLRQAILAMQQQEVKQPGRQMNTLKQLGNIFSSKMQGLEYKCILP